MNDEFFKLIPRAGTTPYVTIPAAPAVAAKQEDKPKKRKWPKFEKGSWKARFLKDLRKSAPSPGTEDFHFVHSENHVVMSGKDRVVRFKRPDMERMRRIAKEDKDSKVYINAGDGEFYRMSIKSYLKLANLDRIMVKFKLVAVYDDDTEVEVYRAEHMLHNINELAHFIIHHNHSIQGVYDVQAECYGFADYRFELKTMVIRNDRKVTTYKDDFNGFMKDYGLRPF